MWKLLQKQGFAPTLIVTDKLKSYHNAFRTLRLNAEHIGNMNLTIAFFFNVNQSIEFTSSNAAMKHLTFGQLQAALPK